MPASSWLEVAREAVKIPGLLVEVYGDLAKPGVTQVGRALETVIGLGNTILWPIALLNERASLSLRANLERYRARMATVPVEEVSPVPPEVGVPVLEKLGYVGDEVLSEVFIRLLETASRVDTAELAHPSFPHVIGRLAPDEARLLVNFGAADFVYPMLSGRWRSDSSRDTLLIDETRFLLDDRFTSGLRYPHRLPAYIANLSAVGVIEHEFDAPLSEPEGCYELLESVWRPRMEASTNFPDRKVFFVRGHIAATTFGEEFLKACMPCEM